MMSKQKKFDAVKMMQEIRDNKRKLYFKNPALRDKNLQKIRIKYDLPLSGQKTPAFE